MAIRTYDFTRPIADDRLQALFRALLKELAKGPAGPRPISTQFSGRREEDLYPLSTMSTWGSPTSGYRKTMIATADPRTETYITSLRYETYGLPEGVRVEYEFSGKSPWTDPEAETGQGRLTLSSDAEEALTTIVALVETMMA